MSPADAPAAAPPADSQVRTASHDALAGGTEVVAPATVAHVRRPLALKHYLWVAAAVVIAYFALTELGAVLTPFLVGAILAYLGTPIVDALERRGVHRNIGTTLVVLLFAIAILGLFVVLVPLVQAEVTLVMKRVPELLTAVNERVLPWLERHLGIAITLDLATLREVLADNIEHVRALGLRLLSGVRTGGLLLLSILINVALVPVVMFYLLRDWNRIVERIDDLLPRRWEGKVREVARQIDDVLAEFLRGQVSVMVVLAVYYAIALSAVGLDQALRSACSPGSWCSFPMSDSDWVSCSASWRRCCSGPAGRSSSRCWRFTASGSSSKTTC